MSAISAGGPTHVRYAHAWRPRELEVRCPTCGLLARASKPSERDLPPVLCDVTSRPAFVDDDWAVSCTACTFRSTKGTFATLPPLYWKLPWRGDELWAWNREHLGFLRETLLGVNVSRHPCAPLGAYVPGEWKRHAKAAVQAIERALRQHEKITLTRRRQNP